MEETEIIYEHREDSTVKVLDNGHPRVLKNLSIVEWCPLLGGNLKKIVKLGTKTYCLLLKTCPLFRMSAIGSFHCISKSLLIPCPVE